MKILVKIRGRLAVNWEAVNVCCSDARWKVFPEKTTAQQHNNTHSPPSMSLILFVLAISWLSMHVPFSSSRKEVSRWGHTSSRREQNEQNAEGPFEDRWSKNISVRFLLDSCPSISLYSPSENTLSYTRWGSTVLTSSSLRIFCRCFLRILAAHLFFFLVHGLLPGLWYCLFCFFTNHLLVPLPNIFDLRRSNKTWSTAPSTHFPKEGRCIFYASEATMPHISWSLALLLSESFIWGRKKQSGQWLISSWVLSDAKKITRLLSTPMQTAHHCRQHILHHFWAT